MEARNLRKERTGVVVSNKMDKTITVAAKFKENTLFMVNSFLKRRNSMLMTKRMNAKSEILFVLWKLVL